LTGGIILRVSYARRLTSISSALLKLAATGAQGIAGACRSGDREPEPMLALSVVPVKQ
jgi:hypothetical protein